MYRTPSSLARDQEAANAPADTGVAPAASATPAPLVTEYPAAQRKVSHSSDESVLKKEHEGMATAVLQHDTDEVEESRLRRHLAYERLRPFILGGLAALILGWWISATVLQATRHRWCVTSAYPAVELC